LVNRAPVCGERLPKNECGVGGGGWDAFVAVVVGDGDGGAVARADGTFGGVGFKRARIAQGRKEGHVQVGRSVGRERRKWGKQRDDEQQAL
jgi:hypothetical protein